MRILHGMNAAESPFRIYDASAGSGKTYTLTREYLVILLTPAAGQAFREILAITFTNKAVAELKHRILSKLYDFARTPGEDGRSDLFRSVQQATGSDWESLRARSARVLQEILH
ncbi:MAG TPA: UvrD-helicase domain-containing protein, partial [Robiginitalea sp.]|nr:UvrD-helicase domain-containing protein [Robiginitalea sp.]